METPATAPERIPRCRYHNRRDNPCPNPALTDDPKSIRLCSRHALEAVHLLAEEGVIRYQIANTRRTAWPAPTSSTSLSPSASS